jgi:hypothetical protein
MLKHGDIIKEANLPSSERGFNILEDPSNPLLPYIPTS